MAVLLLAAGCSGSDDPSSGDELADLLVDEPLPGFERLGHDSLEDGDLELDELASLFTGREDRTRAELETAGWVASSSAHWTTLAQSLVLRIDEFETPAGAAAWVGAPAEGSTPIPGITGARLTEVVHESRIGRPVDDYRSAAYQRLTLGQVCRFAVVVFLRSAEETVPDERLVAVFRRQVRAVRPAC